MSTTIDLIGEKAQDTNVSNETPVDTTTPVVTEEEPQIEEKKPYQIFGYRKTACFGKCPVYEVKIYTDNTSCDAVDL